MVTGSVVDAYRALPAATPVSGAAYRADAAPAAGATAPVAARLAVKASDYSNLTRGELASIGRELFLRGAISKDQLADFESPSVNVAVTSDIAGSPARHDQGDSGASSPGRPAKSDGDVSASGYAALQYSLAPETRGVSPESRVSLRV